MESYLWHSDIRKIEFKDKCIETTINDVAPFKSFHASEQSPDEKPEWRQMRKSVADMPRRTEIADASNKRYVKALTTIDATTVATHNIKGAFSKKGRNTE
jgi:Fe-S cluster assembly scaffold protein SufB